MVSRVLYGMEQQTQLTAPQVRAMELLQMQLDASIEKPTAYSPFLSGRSFGIVSSLRALARRGLAHVRYTPCGVEYVIATADVDAVLRIYAEKHKWWWTHYGSKQIV